MPRIVQEKSQVENVCMEVTVILEEILASDVLASSEIHINLGYYYCMLRENKREIVFRMVFVADHVDWQSAVVDP